MAEHPRAPKGDPPSRAANPDADDAQPSPRQQQATAHARGRICKVRGCEVCAPLRERRRLKKAQRRADAQAQAHARNQPCGRSNCPVPACVRARHADPATPTATPTPAAGPHESDDGAATLLHRQAERHRAGLACGSEACPSQVCVEGFARERARRHRARRPCASAECANPICVASRTDPSFRN